MRIATSPAIYFSPESNRNIDKNRSALSVGGFWKTDAPKRTRTSSSQLGACLRKKESIIADGLLCSKVTRISSPQWGHLFGKEKEFIISDELLCPQGDSNPCLGLERAPSWAARRWGRLCIACFLFEEACGIVSRMPHSF